MIDKIDKLLFRKKIKSSLETCEPRTQGLLHKKLQGEVLAEDLDSACKDGFSHVDLSLISKSWKRDEINQFQNSTEWSCGLKYNNVYDKVPKIELE